MNRIAVNGCTGIAIAEARPGAQPPALNFTGIQQRAGMLFTGADSLNHRNCYRKLLTALQGARDKLNAMYTVT
jgi:hypothetical protein